MKLSNLTAKLTCLKSSAVRALTAATLAGAVLVAAAPAAEAQHFDAHISGPHFVAPQRDIVVVRPDRFVDGRFDNRRFEVRRAPVVVVERPEVVRFHHVRGYARPY